MQQTIGNLGIARETAEGYLCYGVRAPSRVVGALVALCQAHLFLSFDPLFLVLHFILWR